MATVEGGYDYEFVEPPPEGLLCKICQLPCREAQSSEGRVYCKRCIPKTEYSDSVDRDVKALKVCCPNKKDGCSWTGEIARVDGHVKECKISCRKCKQIVYFSTMRSHLDTECPCYCPYCDITAEREVISSEHKNCHNFPITCPNNIGTNNSPQDKFDVKTNKINEMQNNIFERINETFNPSILVELQKDISTIKEKVALSIQIAKECPEKVDKQKDTTLMDQLCNIRSHLTVAVLISIIAILIALLFQSPHGMSEDQMVEHLTSLQAELYTISQSVSELQSMEHNSLYNKQIEDIIRGMDHKLYETKEQLYRLWQIITELNQSVSKLQPMQQNASLWNKQVEETIREMDGKLHETKDQLKSAQVDTSKYFAKELHSISLSVSEHLSKIDTLNVIQHEVNGIKEQLYSLQVKLEGDVIRNITELRQHIILFQEILNRTVTHQQYHCNDSVWSTKLWLPTNKVAPVIVMVSGFTKYLRDKEEWYSDPFFAFEGGYRMCVRVDPAGHYNRSSTDHVGVFLHLTKGPHDDELEQSGHWPLRGRFTIELLNQLNDSDHYAHSIQQYHHICSDCTERVVHGRLAKRGWGYPDYISSNDLIYPLLNRGVLFFRISYEHTNSLIKYDQISPVTITISRFTEKIEYSEEWYSSPFLAFEGGYQLCLKVYAAGYGDGEGTHVSVFLYLMKGPHDDKLEQSGHWPLRGSFTIELLNQLNDGDHYIQTVMPATIGTVNRVEEKDEIHVIKAILQFISHDTLFQHNGYLKNDALVFRVSSLQSAS